MEGSEKLILHLQNVNEILRSPGKSYRKRMITGDAEDFIIEQAENLPRKETINIADLAVWQENASYRFRVACCPVLPDGSCHWLLAGKQNCNAHP